MAGEDDMIYFESEDEKWMMGDFDIDLDVDLGRPIDFEGEESAVNQDDSGFQDADSSGGVDPRKGPPSVPAPGASASAQRNGIVSVSGHNNPAQRLGGSNLANSTSTGVNPSRPANDINSNGNGNNGNGNKELNFPNVRSGGNGTSIGNGNNRGQPPNGSTGTGNGNGGKVNPSNSTSTVQSSGSGNSRPSAGGFSFPPGVVRVIFLSLSQFLGRKADETNRTLPAAGRDPCLSIIQPAITTIRTRTRISPG
jgi:hypothetical protein